ncbi:MULTISPECIES: helix-turn-helix transcriptional regulator [unclassified Enterococcus]|uniref:helix-turn-helix transcriptional regulator n=1 Tax=unclassified Enterococcus TaxID=2608891 RepID=UPI001CE1049E|nr:MULTISPECIES: YafY family protein [unclassified Enterococcus]MCA5011557.1 YafY family transcriptional regulator [Enterococcus sp. S23]MCA5015001.1 YafY family transcriptional regulator [Enterococcus sp. S22(2020)]
MKLNRMFEIVYLLLERKKMTTMELAKHFEVSKRTILRDIEALSIAGIPIYTTKGKGGGISLLDHYVLDKSVISADEQNQILFALQSLAVTHHLNAATTLSKLQTLFKKTDTSWIEVDFSRWGKTDPDNQKFELLKNALLTEKALSFSYATSYGSTSLKIVYPLKLLFKSKAWYLQAYCMSKQDYRTYKINRITDLEILDDSFSRSSYTVPAIEEKDSPTLLHLTLLFAKESAFRAYDEFDMKDIQINQDGSLLVDALLPEDYWLYSFLLSLGTTVKVLSPAHVEKKLLTQVEEIKKNYLNL